MEGFFDPLPRWISFPSSTHTFTSQFLPLELRDEYRSHWKKYIKSVKRLSSPASEDPSLVSARIGIEVYNAFPIPNADVMF